MDVLETHPEAATLRFTAVETVMIANLLYEVCSGEFPVDEEAFPGLFGATRADALALLEQFGELLADD